MAVGRLLFGGQLLLILWLASVLLVDGRKSTSTTHMSGGGGGGKGGGGGGGGSGKRGGGNNNNNNNNKGGNNKGLSLPVVPNKGSGGGRARAGRSCCWGHGSGAYGRSCGNGLHYTAGCYDNRYVYNHDMLFYWLIYEDMKEHDRREAEQASHAPPKYKNQPPAPGTVGAGMVWWYNITTIPVRNTDLERVLTPRFYVQSVEDAPVCPPYPAVDRDGMISSGIDQDWDEIPQNFCADGYPRSPGYQGANYTSQIYARTFLPTGNGTDVDRLNNLGVGVENLKKLDSKAAVVTYAIMSPLLFNDNNPAASDQWAWLSIDIFLSDRNDYTSIDRICLNAVQCYKRTPTYTSAPGILAPKVMLYYDEDLAKPQLQASIPQAFQQTGPDGHLYDVLDYDLLPEVSRRALNADVWAQANPINDKLWLMHINYCLSLPISPDVLY